MALKYRKAIKIINNDFNNKIHQSFFTTSDTFYFLAYSSNYQAIIPDPPKTDIILPMISGIVFTTDPSSLK